MGLKLIGSLMVILSGSSIGIIFSYNCSSRLKELHSLQIFFNLLENEIKFLSRLLKDAFKTICKISIIKDSCIANFFTDTIKFLDQDSNLTASQAWQLAVNQNIKLTSLNAEDQEILLSFGNMLGNSDIDGQVKNIRLTMNRLKIQEKEAEEYKKKNELMYRRLGVLTSVAVVIILF